MLQAQIFIDKDEFKGTQPLVEYILQFLIQREIKGATVIRGEAGFGATHHLKHPTALFSFDELPMLITFIDDDTKVIEVVKELREHMKRGLITTNQVETW